MFACLDQYYMYYSTRFNTCVLSSTVKYRARDLCCQYKSARISVFLLYNPGSGTLYYTANDGTSKAARCSLLSWNVRRSILVLGDCHVIELVVCKRFEYLLPDPPNLLRFSGCLPFENDFAVSICSYFYFSYVVGYIINDLTPRMKTRYFVDN